MYSSVSSSCATTAAFCSSSGVGSIPLSVSSIGPFSTVTEVPPFVQPLRTRLLDSSCYLRKRRRGFSLYTSSSGINGKDPGTSGNDLGGSNDNDIEEDWNEKQDKMLDSSSSTNGINGFGDVDVDIEEMDEAAFLRQELVRLESLEEILKELEELGINEDDYYDDDESEEHDGMVVGAGIDDDDFFNSTNSNGSSSSAIDGGGGKKIRILGDDANNGEDDDDAYFWDENSLQELLGSVANDDDQNINVNKEEVEKQAVTLSSNSNTADEGKEKTTKTRNSSSSWPRFKPKQAAALENALLQGVVPANAGVGSNCLPGDFGFDPFDLASKDYFQQVQNVLLRIIPEKDNNNNDGKSEVQKEMKQQNKEVSADDDNDVDDDNGGPRPKALILRDYREAEIRHSRLAMIAAVFWPLQEMLDKLLLPEEYYNYQTNSIVNSLLFGGVTLPYFPLLMTAIMLLLGYLDIYSQAIKDMDKIGEAYLPGDCFWDPLAILQGAPDSMKRNMIERELFNGRMAMLAIAIFIFEEIATGKPIISIGRNDILFVPIFQLPYVQEWLDQQFATSSTSALSSSTVSVIEDFVNNSDGGGGMINAILDFFM